MLTVEFKRVTKGTCTFCKREKDETFVVSAGPIKGAFDKACLMKIVRMQLDEAAEKQPASAAPTSNSHAQPAARV
jgi:hypothetical protein